MRYFKFFCQWFASTWDFAKGPRLLLEITPPQSIVESLVGYSINEYVITIHCQERKYRYEYKHRFIPNKEFHSYFVFATVSGEAPKVLCDACTMERAFPKLLESWMPSENQKEAAIGAYLDLLIDRLYVGSV